MKNKKDDIEDLFRNRFENEEAPVSPIVWENIQKTLPNESHFGNFNLLQSILFWWLSALLFVSVIGAAIAYHSILWSQKHTTLVSAPSGTNNTTIKYKVKNTDQTLDPLEHHAIVLFTEQPTSASIVDSDLPKKPVSDSKRLHKKTVLPTYHLHSASYNANTMTEKLNPDLLPVKNKSSNKTKETRVKNKTTYDASLTSSFLNAEKNLRLKKTNQGQRTFNDTVKKNDSQQNNSLAQTKNNAPKNKRLLISDKNQKETNATSLVYNASTEPLKKSDSLHQGSSKQSKHASDSLSATESKNHTPSSEIATDLLIKNSVTTNYDDFTEKQSVELNSKKDSFQSMTADTSVITRLTVDSIKFTKDIKENARLRSYREEAKEVSGTVNEIFSKTKYESENNRRKKNHQEDDSTSSNSNSPIATSTLLNTEIKKDSLASTTDSTKKALPDSIQTKVSSEKKKSEESIVNRWSVDLLGSGVLTGSTTKARDANYQTAASDKKDRSKNLPGYTFGVTINYKLTNKFRLSTGVFYTAFSEQYHFNYTLKRTAWMYVDTTWQYVQVDSINNDKIVKDQYRFLSIPLQVSYTFLTKGKLSLSATAGIRSNILLKGNTYLANANGTDVMKLNSGFRSLNFSYLAALEMQYQFKPRMALLAQPVFNYSANSIYNSSAPIKQKLYSIGVTIGLRIMF